MHPIKLQSLAGRSLKISFPDDEANEQMSFLRDLHDSVKSRLAVYGNEASAAKKYYIKLKADGMADSAEQVKKRLERLIRNLGFVSIDVYQFPFGCLNDDLIGRLRVFLQEAELLEDKEVLDKDTNSQKVVTVNKGKYSNAAINAYMSAVKNTCRQAFLLEQMSAREYEKIAEWKQKKHTTVKEHKIVPAEAFRRLVDACDRDKNVTKGARDKAILYILMCHGIRRSAFSSMEMSKVKEEKRFVEGNEITGIRVVYLVKGGSEDTLFVHDEAKIALEEWLEHRGHINGPLFVKVAKSGKVTNTMGDDTPALSDRSVYDIVKARCKESGLENYGVHNFRHTVGTTVMRRTQSLNITQHTLNHKEPKSTQIYNQAKDDDAILGANEMLRYLTE